MDTKIEFPDIQGNILSGYGFPFAQYVMVRARSREAGRRLLGELTLSVTPAVKQRQDARNDPTLNVAITHSGFGLLGLPPTLLQRFPDAFRGPVKDRADRLHDVGSSAPQHWNDHLGTSEVHFLLMLHGSDAGLVGRRKQDLFDTAEGIEVLHQRDAHLRKNRREHFGYADGFGQPDIEGVSRLSGSRGKAPYGHGIPVTADTWRPLKVGEFVLGYPDEDGVTVTQPAPWLVRNGSYLVYRELCQDAAGFHRALEEAAQRSGLHKELLAAKLVGRWRNGVPLELSPDRSPDDLYDKAIADPPNDFQYMSQDPKGYLCPLGAHIRRTNPRDVFGSAGRLSARHRILRRGMPYGPAYNPGSGDDGTEGERGLVFLCLQADIERQFETIQRDWCNDGDSFGLADERDYFLGGDGGSPTVRIPVRGDAPRFVARNPNLVVTRGTEYFFVPGLATLRALAAGRY